MSTTNARMFSNRHSQSTVLLWSKEIWFKFTTRMWSVSWNATYRLLSTKENFPKLNRLENMLKDNLRFWIDEHWHEQMDQPWKCIAALSIYWIVSFHRNTPSRAAHAPKIADKFGLPKEAISPAINPKIRYSNFTNYTLSDKKCANDRNLQKVKVVITSTAGKITASQNNHHTQHWIDVVWVHWIRQGFATSFRRKSRHQIVVNFLT